jgi:anthranilate/para-aminobenzoate synthase component I
VEERLEITSRIEPDRATFDRLAAEWPLVPLWTELLSDVSTPVGLFPSLAGDGPGLLLESVERSERWGRFSFVAGDPAAILVADERGVHLRDVNREELPIGEPSQRLHPRDALKATARQLRAPSRARQIAEFNSPPYTKIDAVRYR